MDGEFDARIRGACEAGDHSASATLFIEHHGTELLTFLCARLRSRSDGEEVFAIVAEKLWLGLPSFEWRSTLRSWVYRLARNAANDFVGAAHRKPGRRLALPQDADFAERVRTTTALYRRTEVKDRMRELREALDPDDQMLLYLRVDRGLDFRELAVAMAAGDVALSEDDLTREAARLRKRFARVKEQLRELARDAGLI
jgi:RNA polymerase sigma-70 factor (ECF subfamily)